MDGLIGFVLAGFALMGSPGPVNMSLAAVGVAFGARRAIRFLLGVGVGMLLVMAIAASGVTGLVLAVPGAAVIAGSLAAAYMLYLAYRIAMAPPVTSGNGEDRAPRFGGGLVLALANPKAYAAMTALFSGFVLIQGRAVTKLLVLTPMMVTVVGGWLLLGAALTRLYRDPRISRVMNVGFAVLLLLSVLVVFLL